MKVMISGSHGLVGTALCSALEADFHEVVRLGRDFSQPIDFRGVEAVIHLAGENIAEGRWNASKKERIEKSRVEGTRLLANQIGATKYKPNVFISSSAIGYYGHRPDEIIDENSVAGRGFLPDVCRKWEEAAKPAEASGVRTVFLRTGIILSVKGGALKKMLPPFKLGGGGILGSGKQYVSWISITDMVEIIQFFINNTTLSGAFNLVAPNPVSNYEFTKTLGNLLHRPTIMPLPAFTARLLFGEMADALLLSSCNVQPNRLLEAGYIFRHAELKYALEDILK